MKILLSTKQVFFIIVVIFFLLPISVPAFPGKVVGITDGDTVKVLRSETHIQVKIRLAGIDTPEKKQAFGQKAKKFTAGLLANRIVEVKPITKDRYGRTVGYIYCDGQDVNLAIVKNGYAWVYRKYAPKPKSKADNGPWNFICVIFP
ncbi:MAG: thermonuclease family protein [Pseudomonadota bacterium]|nr:thermonuclease family protein [Pseudomonadota bacterium]